MVDARTVELTANNNTPYTWFWVDLRGGPLVIEVPPKVLGLLLLPSWVIFILLGRAPDTAHGLLVARFIGAPLLSLGVACWWAGGDEAGRAGAPLIRAMLLYDVLAAIPFLYARVALGLAGVALWPAVVVHLALAAWCIAGLRQGAEIAPRREARSGK
jgi:Protein of unknown function (DUF1254)